MLYANSLFPFITKPTRITSETATIIDNIYTNDFSHQLQNHQGMSYSEISDHYPIFHFRRTISDVNDKHAYLMKRQMKQSNVDDFVTSCSNIDWTCVTSLEDTQSAYSTLHSRLNQVYMQSFPMVKVKLGYETRNPWLTPALKQSIKIKNKIYLYQLKYSTEQNKKQYRIYRNRLTNLLRVAEKDYYCVLLTKHKSDLKKSCNIIKQIINKKGRKKCSTKFYDGEETVTDQNIIANKFDNFFTNIGPTLAKLIPQSNHCPKSYLNNRIDESIYLNPVTEHETSKVIENLKSSAAGWDEFQPRIIKIIKDILLTPLTYICNLSFTQGIFPGEFKLANVIPIFKSGEDTRFDNYRPVSVLPVISKIFERLMYDRLLNFLNQHKFFYKYQFGFQKKHSTYMALLTLVHQISNALENGNSVLGIFLDYPKHLILWIMKLY